MSLDVVVCVVSRSIVGFLCCKRTLAEDSRMIFQVFSVFVGFGSPIKLACSYLGLDNISKVMELTILGNVTILTNLAAFITT